MNQLRWVVGLLVAAIPASAMAEAVPARHVPAYDLPVPSTVSPELQGHMANAPPSVAPPAMPTTNAGWEKFFNPDPAKTQARIAQLLVRYALSMSEETIGGVHCYRIIPSTRAAKPRRLLMHLHGGAHVGGAGQSGLLEAVLVAGTTGVETVSVDYRMPPSHPYPTPMNDAEAVWTQLSLRYPEYRLGIFGTSSGGAMVLALTQRTIAGRQRAPDAIMAGTPWSDLSETGDSYFTNRYADPIIYPGVLSVAAAQYAGGLDVRDPRLSPVYGDFTGFPPTLLLAGTRDIFLSNTVRVDRKLRDAGRRSELIVYEGQSHAAYLIGPEIPETKTALDDIAAFFTRELRSGGSPGRGGAGLQ